MNVLLTLMCRINLVNWSNAGSSWYIFIRNIVCVWGGDVQFLFIYPSLFYQLDCRQENIKIPPYWQFICLLTWLVYRIYQLVLNGFVWHLRFLIEMLCFTLGQCKKNHWITETAMFTNTSGSRKWENLALAFQHTCPYHLLGHGSPYK